MFQENCYVVSDETMEAVIVDCGALFPAECDAIAKYVKENQLTVKRLIATHGHLDHNFGDAFVWREYGVKVELHGGDEHPVTDLSRQAKDFFGFDYPVENPIVGGFFSGEDTVKFGSHEFEIIHTPGHSKGSVLYYCKEENVVFSGDTLFQGSMGRTDLPGGSPKQMEESLKKIADLLPNEVVVYPGHGRQTTMEMEKRYNPYLR